MSDVVGAYRVSAMLHCQRDNVNLNAAGPPRLRALPVCWFVVIAYTFISCSGRMLAVVRQESDLPVAI